MQEKDIEAITHLAFTNPKALLGALAAQRVVTAARNGESVTLDAEEAKEFEAFINFTRDTIQAMVNDGI